MAHGVAEFDDLRQATLPVLPVAQALVFGDIVADRIAAWLRSVTVVRPLARCPAFVMEAGYPWAGRSAKHGPDCPRTLR